MKINYKKLLLSILIPLLVGGVSALFTKDSMDIYINLNQPVLSPPGFIFPIVWTILYILMGISAYFISFFDGEEEENAQKIYIIQLILNFIWSIIFFNYNNFILSFIILIILWLFILKMIISFYKINPIAGYLQIPYLLWVTFAGYLNFMIILLN
ncbi:TspO/MBR family protein [Anaerofustis sp. NSJ-163]|uniref:TspO/MBR family protein n=1 Tax=Anaerofustis sp. NSJ-163 TaxID=2944391 RepID=UPI00209C29B0|nr:TspO/MBR family protein [Anaerofustis sp. NSJ-163]MCO8192825.1 tryptophan-rich sensory protein [Anaerofustis sp. NSJ-163]